MKKNLEELIAKADESPDGTAHEEIITTSINEDSETFITTTSKTTVGKTKSAPKERASDDSENTPDEVYVIDEEIQTVIKSNRKATATKHKEAPTKDAENLEPVPDGAEIITVDSEATETINTHNHKATAPKAKPTPKQSLQNPDSEDIAIMEVTTETSETHTGVKKATAVKAKPAPKS